ncbi:AAA family ATPase [Sphaerisporangium rhizosphaerae]|uniref:AAA family ATPase n=1 Tax=Sphaerisporangium rhizosphaerae TaxID=2269375 RepID=A0ABW2PM06_9ACTN
MDDAPDNGLEILVARLDVHLRGAVDRVLASYGPEPAGDPFRGLYISQPDIVHLLATWDAHPVQAPRGMSPLSDMLDARSRPARLADAYGLTGFELELLIMAMSPDLHPRYERVYAFLQDDVSRRRPGADLALALLTGSFEERIARRAHLVADAPLIRHGLVDLIDDAPETPAWSRPLRADEAVTRHLLGIPGLGAALRSCCALVDPSGATGATGLLDPSDRHAGRGPVDMPGEIPLAALTGDGERPLRLYLPGPDAAARRRLATGLAAQAGVPLLVADLARLSGENLDRLLPLTVREAGLRGAVLLAESFDDVAEEDRDRVAASLAEHRAVTLLGGTAPPPARSGWVTVPLQTRPPGTAERRREWERSLAALGVTLSEDELDQLAGRFQLAPEEVRGAVTAARLRSAEPDLPGLLTAARAQCGTSLTGLARRIEPVHDWADLVLPDDAVRQLEEIRQQVAHRHQVLSTWGFGRRLSLGKGVTALFTGVSGTGKTTAAEIIAGDLGLDLYKIDLSGVVSKYIGETEKNLARIFSARDAVLFFDEADALFGKRSEVRDSHDRYANIEIAYLLQRMEEYEGVAILASNLRQNMDDAFVRRLQFVVEFPFPGEEQRALIWKAHFPPESEVDSGVDLSMLARGMRISGGTIKNIVLAAAYLAAARGPAPISMDDLLHAARREYHKMGRVLTDDDLAPWTEGAPAAAADPAPATIAQAARA